MKVLLPLALSLGITLLLLFGSLHPALVCGLLFVDIILALAALSFFIAPVHVQQTRPRAIAALPHSVLLRDGLPSVPRTVREVLATMSPEQFELFSAAVIVGLGEGYSFVEHCGGSGDQGVDVKLLNVFGLRVMVQCKEYTPGNPVGSSELRDFSGAITFYNAIYGFFITTSTFTDGAQRIIASNPTRIRAIDGRRLETYLQWRPREIALAWREVLDKRDRGVDVA